MRYQPKSIPFKYAVKTSSFLNKSAEPEELFKSGVCNLFCKRANFKLLYNFAGQFVFVICIVPMHNQGCLLLTVLIPKGDEDFIFWRSIFS